MFGLSPEVIAQGGLIVIAIIIFFESGVMVGFFLPGDTLLFTSGILASQGQINIVHLISIVTIAAMLGDNAGYAIGRISGKHLFRKKDSALFKREYIEKAEKFYEKHGAKTMLISRIIPIVRNFAPPVAGIARMNRFKFFVYNGVGAVIWACLFPLIGYFIGSKIPGIGQIMEHLIVLVVLVSITPLLVHLLMRKLPKSKINKILIKLGIKKPSIKIDTPRDQNTN